MDPQRVSQSIRWWYPRDILSRTNWLYRVDALRAHDRREMDVLWELSSLFLEYTSIFTSWAASLSLLTTRADIKTLYQSILSMASLLWCEGYCYYLDFLEIQYFPSTNRQDRFLPHQKSIIDDLDEAEAYRLTGFSRGNLRRLYIHWRIPNQISLKYRFTGERCFILYLAFNRTGWTKLQLSNEFGGDPRCITYSIRAITNHLFKNFYHKVSGDSMRMWLPFVSNFRHAIWHKLQSGVTAEEIGFDEQLGENPERYIFLDIPLDTFRIFGFLDDTAFKTNAPGRSTQRSFGFVDDVQRSFYSGYFKAHGLKAQVVFLPNRMVGSIYLASLRNSDSGLLNMSNLNNYFATLFDEASLRIEMAGNQYPAVYADGIFLQLTCIVARYRNPQHDRQRRINRRMASIRQSIEHLFGFHYNIFHLFHYPERFRLLVSGVEIYKMMFNSFFCWNCYQCIYHTSNTFSILPPSLEEYLPLDEVLVEAPVVSDEALGTTYRYH